MLDFKTFSLFDPSPQHKALRDMLSDFVKKELEAQAQEYDKKEEFNQALFQKLGNLGLLGLNIQEEELGG